MARDIDLGKDMYASFFGVGDDLSDLLLGVVPLMDSVFWAAYGGVEREGEPCPGTAS